eukprot:gene10028-13484_t
MSKKSSFPDVKPLAGQSGYNAKESDILSKDAKEMENRLKFLQDRLLVQQQENDSNPNSNNGSKWKSSRVEKGGIRTYGKEVQEKIRKKSEAEGGGDPILRHYNNTKKLQQTTNTNNRGDFRTKDATYWTISDVSDWLRAISLDQYSSIFSQNEINGLILLDITLDDLDYMGITILGHRKLLLKGAEELRKNKRVNADMALPKDNIYNNNNNNDNNNQLILKENSQSKESFSSDEIKIKTEKENSNKTIHWSHLEPLHNGKAADSSSVSMINPADGMIDEEAERLAFMEAVSEWRKGGTTQKVKIIREEGVKYGNGKTAASQNDDINNYDIDNNSNFLKGGGEWKNPFASNYDDISSNDQNDVKPQPQYSLLNGVLDEELERQEFKKAVEAWRSGGKSNDKVSTSHNTTTQSSSNGTSASTYAEPSVRLVDKLSKQFENELEESSKRLEQQKKDATSKLAK